MDLTMWKKPLVQMVVLILGIAPAVGQIRRNPTGVNVNASGATIEIDYIAASDGAFDDDGMSDVFEDKNMLSVTNAADAFFDSD